MVTLPTFLPIPEAARKYGLEEARLRQLVEKGKIRAGVVAGEMVVSEEEVQKRVEREIQKRAEREQGSGVRKEDLPEWKQFSHLDGKGIGLSEAAQSYKVNAPTIYRWYKAGFIRKVGKKTVRGGTKMLLNEADVAYCAYVYLHSGWSRGKRVFRKEGLPHSISL
jgi:transposase-like protein